MGSELDIVVFPGDCAGPEVMAEGLKVLHAASRRYPDVRLNLTTYPIGGSCFDRHGVAVQPEALEHAKRADAVLLGAVGGPKWAGQTPSVEVASLGALRRGLEAFGNLRPVSFAAPSLALTSPLKPEACAGTDIMVVRELTGGIYFGAHQSDAHSASDVDQYTYDEVARAARLAGVLATQGRGSDPLPIISLDKSNVLSACGTFWRRVVSEVLAAEFPDVPLSHLLIDSAAMTLACKPAKLNGVVLTSNLFGDIISDQCSAIVGSIGMLPSASLRGVPDAADRGTTKGLYEPVHGSAPDIAGEQLVNPIGMILSVAMMFRYSLGMPDAAQRIEQAVSETIEAGIRTPDLGGTATTSEVGTAVAKALESLV